VAVVIRTIRGDEAAQFSAFLRETFMKTYAHCSSAENVAKYVEQQYHGTRQSAELADPALHSLVLIVDDEWAGVAQLHIAPVEPGSGAAPGFISRFYFRTQYQGRGLAQLLLAELIRIARVTRIDVLQLSAWKNAPQALRFYAKAGFQSIATADFVVGEAVLEDWLMQLRL
jgi:ribosomal protein S18 acetylase RimI-like enzyme